MVLNAVLDTNVVLYLLGGRLDDPLPGGAINISVITEMEILSYPSLDSATESKIRRFLDGVTRIGLTREIRDAAIALRRENRIKLPDAIIAATALTLDAELLTNDRGLLGIEKVRARPVKIKPD